MWIVWQTIHMKCQDLFSLENNAAIVINALRVKSKEHNKFHLQRKGLSGIKEFYTKTKVVFPEKIKLPVWEYDSNTLIIVLP